jgi:hypothetical protein
MKNFKAKFKRDASHPSHASYTSHLASLILFAAGVALLAICTGCATKTRNIDLDGMYVSEAGTLAVGSIEVMASPVGEESAAIRYAEDTAWLSPSTKTHEIKILLTGTNAIAAADGIVSNICAAFTATAPTIANTSPARTSETSSVSPMILSGKNDNTSTGTAGEL